MAIGAEARSNIGLMQRIVREGNEIGNHTWTHPDISEISPRQLDLEINLTERLFESKLGVQPLYFRPPYDIDEEPDTDDEAAPAWRIQQMGYTIIGSKIDTDDWNEHPRKTPGDYRVGLRAAEDHEDQAAVPRLHHPAARRRRRPLSDRGRAGPLIDALRAHGYTIVPVSALMGKTTAQVMPPLTFWQRMRTIPDSIAFSALDIIGNFIVMVFFVGDILMSARLVIVGSSPSSTACASAPRRPRPASIRASRFSFPPTTKRRSSCAPSARCSTPTTRTSMSS
jgi:peptidoglycan-N-acetylglucosamine deacetylase